MTTLEQIPQSVTPDTLEQAVSIPLSEAIPTPENESELLQQRIEMAIGDCKIEPTAEVQEALHGYYGDHYALASMIKAAATSEITDEQIESVLELPDGAVSADKFDTILDFFSTGEGLIAPPSAESATKLLAASMKKERSVKSPEERDKQHGVTIRLAWGALSEVIFQESSLGISTISDPEFELVRHLHGILSEATPTIAVHPDTPRHSIEYPQIETIENKIVKAHTLFWDDVRYAGQLEFTNTAYLKDVVASGGLMPRTEQFRRNGKMNTATGTAGGSRSTEGKMHSVVPHFSERYQIGMYKGGDSSGTVALPLAEIIRIAPFARDAQYAVVNPRTTDLSKIPMRTTEGLMMGTAGGRDEAPESLGVDRVFFATSSEKGERKPDQFVLPVDRESGATIILMGDEVENSKQYGSNDEGAPQLHVEGSGGMEEEVFGEPNPRIKNHDVILEQISGLQRKYLNDPRYKGRLVVPLRRGVFDFRTEGMKTTIYRENSEYDTIPS